MRRSVGLSIKISVLLMIIARCTSKPSDQKYYNEGSFLSFKYQESGFYFRMSFECIILIINNNIA
jgi:hypothetical protein